MAQEKEAAAAAAPRPGRGMMAMVGMLVVGVGSAGAGFAVPYMMNSEAAAKPVVEQEHGEKAAKKQSHETSPSAFVPFGEVVANLDDHRMMRYVRAKFSLAVEPKDSQAVQHLVEENRLVLKNWLIGYLQNKQIEEVRGTEGFNRVCREIGERFNQSLFPDGDEKIKEILFEEFNVQ